MNKSDIKRIARIAKKIHSINILGGKCKKCGETNIFKLCFHHKEPNKKEFTISDLRRVRWSKLKTELKKCELLCNNCHYEYHYSNNKNNKYTNNKKLFLQYKGICECERCGYNKNNAALDFHHNDSTKKDFILSDIKISFNNLKELTQKIENEINKCEIICKNCHSIEHSDVYFFEKHKDDIIKKSKNIKEIQSKIDREKVKELYENGMKQIEISKFFNASPGTICDIIKKIKKEKTGM